MIVFLGFSDDVHGNMVPRYLDTALLVGGPWGKLCADQVIAEAIFGWMRTEEELG